MENSCLVFVGSDKLFQTSVCLGVGVGVKKSKERGFLEFLVQAMATHSSSLAWKIPWKIPEEPGRLQSMGSQRVRHD